MKHKHAELIMEYAKDAMETDKPWERWQIKMKNDAQWEDIQQCPLWLEYYEYRRKPTTININGHEVPEPVRSPLKNGTIYYIPIIHAMEEDVVPTYKFEWCGDLTDLALLKKGVVHLTEEDCVKHTKALLSFTSEDL